MVVVGTFHTHFDHGSHPSNGIPCLSVCTHIHVVVLPVDVVVFSSRLGWWKALPVSPATSSKVQKCHCYWVGGRSKIEGSFLGQFGLTKQFRHFGSCFLFAKFQITKPQPPGFQVKDAAVNKTHGLGWVM